MPTVTCFQCRQEFVPDNKYEFPNYYVYWHKCFLGDIAQNVVMKEKKKYWWKKKEMTMDESFNKSLEEFHDPWRFHARKKVYEEDQ